METKRCQLTKISKAHETFYHEVQTDEDIRKYLGGIPSITHIKKRFNAILDSEDIWYWAVTDKSENTLIGLISIEPYEETGGYEISYQFLPNWWGKGYAYETVLKVMDYAFKTLSLGEMKAVTQSKNKRSRVLLEKLGMERETVKVMFNEEQSIYSLERRVYLESSMFNQ